MFVDPLAAKRYKASNFLGVVQQNVYLDEPMHQAVPAQVPGHPAAEVVGPRPTAAASGSSGLGEWGSATRVATLASSTQGEVPPPPPPRIQMQIPPKPTRPPPAVEQPPAARDVRLSEGPIPKGFVKRVGPVESFAKSASRAYSTMQNLLHGKWTPTLGPRLDLGEIANIIVRGGTVLPDTLFSAVAPLVQATRLPVEQRQFADVNPVPEGQMGAVTVAGTLSLITSKKYRDKMLRAGYPAHELDDDVKIVTAMNDLASDEMKRHTINEYHVRMSEKMEQYGVARDTCISDDED